MKIRKLRKNDISACAEIFKTNYEKSVKDEEFIHDSASMYILSHFNSDACFVLENDAEVVGFCLCVLSYWMSGSQAIIYEIDIKKAHQGQGLGTYLYNHVEKKLKNIGVQSIMLGSESDTSAQKFHKNNGFFTGDEVVMYKNI